MQTYFGGIDEELITLIDSTMQAFVVDLAIKEAQIGSAFLPPVAFMML